jgi:DNA-binding Lrp family transcriptional regulator
VWLLTDLAFSDNLPEWFVIDLEFLEKYEAGKNKPNVIRLWRKTTGDQFPLTMMVNGDLKLELPSPSPASAIHGRGHHKNPYMGDFVFHGVPDYIRFSKICRGDLLKKIQSLLIGLPQITSRRLTNEETILLLFSAVRDYAVPLSNVDATLLRLLSEDPLAKQRDLVTRTGVSKVTLNRSLKKLKDRCSLRVSGMFNNYKIGLDNLLVMTQKKLEFSSPYLSFGGVLMNIMIPTYVYIFQPPLTSSETMINKISAKSKKTNVGKGTLEKNQRIFRVRSRRENLNMRSFSSGPQQWDINWGLWKILLRDLFMEEGFPVSPSPLEITWDKIPTSVDKKDLMLLDFLVRHPQGLQTPLRILSSTLGMSVWEIRRKLKKLMELSPPILYPNLTVYNIGLNERGASFTYGEQAVKAMTVASLSLPSTSMFLLEDIDSNQLSLLSFYQLPAGGILNLTKSITHADTNLSQAVEIFSSAQGPNTIPLPLDYHPDSEWLSSK